jgi:Ca2+-binding EF-hand superfamily protein
VGGIISFSVRDWRVVAVVRCSFVLIDPLWRRHLQRGHAIYRLLYVGGIQLDSKIQFTAVDCSSLNSNNNMGCGTSSAFIQCYDDLRRSPKFVKWNEMFAALGLRAEEIKALFKVFWNADMDGGGTIDVVELLTVVDVERTPFTERIFSIFDEDRSGKIDFGEFVLALWNYCTLSNYTLGKCHLLLLLLDIFYRCIFLVAAIFAFELYDRDFTGVLERQDLELMLTDIYGKEWKKNHYAKQ